MNYKPTVLISDNNKTVFQKNFLEQLWEQYFTVEILDLNKSYDVRSTVVVSDLGDFCQKQDHNERILANKGIRHVIDHCWDSWNSNLDNSADFTLRPRDFIRINESIWYKHLGYNKFELAGDPERDFLLLMNGLRPHRTKLYNALEPVLPGNIYSYVEHGVTLQNAQDQEFNDTTWQRYVDPTWYTSTRFSVVVESINGPLYVPLTNDDINVTEKTLKPCAFKHPSIVWGQAGTLAWQKRQGFETFEHCVDETYDTVEDEDIRLEKVVEQINICIADKTIFADPLTKQKLEHNYDHFYNEEIVFKLFKEQMVDPLLEFIES
jgi:hypothetical protein